MDWITIIGLINAIIWPLVVLTTLFLYRKPLSKFIARLGSRITKFSAFDISIDLAALPTPPSPWSDKKIIGSSELLGGEVSSTTVMDLFNQIGANQPWDYLIIDIKDGHFWLVSRLYIFTVFLQAMRHLKCVVFVQTTGELRRSLLGLASPDTVRTELGKVFPWLEKALKNALCKHTLYLVPELDPQLAGQIIETFIQDRDMRLPCDPEKLIKTPNNCEISDEERPTDTINPNEWERLGDEKIWEHTHWLNLNIDQVSKTITKSLYEHDTSHYIDSPDVTTEDKTRALIARKAPYIALVNSLGEFQVLIDRQKLVDLVANASIKQ